MLRCKRKTLISINIFDIIVLLYFLVPSPTSSAENFHFKTPSSDSSSSRNGIVVDNSTPKAKLVIDENDGSVRMRPSPIPAISCYNFDAKHIDEISIKRGSKVYVKGRNNIDDEYVLIEVDGKLGYAPKTLLQPEGSEVPSTINGNELVQTKILGSGTFSDVHEVIYKHQVYILMTVLKCNKNIFRNML